MRKQVSINPMTYFLIDVYARFLPKFDVVNTVNEMIKINALDVNFDNDCWIFRKF